MGVIVAEKLTRRYGARSAVENLSFRVARGEIVGFLGPNGAGKTTTLRMIAGYLAPTSGTVSVAGYDVVEQSLEARQRLGYMPESVPLYPEMRVEEYLSFRAEIKGVTTGRRTAVLEAMEQADITSVGRRLVGELSKGYRQRVGLADALVARPELLILDEPTAGLDPNQIVHVRETIKQLGKQHTILLSTHILSEVDAVCSRVVIISRGALVADGTTDEIRQRARGIVAVFRGPTARVREVIARVTGVEVHGEPARIAGDADGDSSVHRYVLDVTGSEDASAAAIEATVAAVVSAGLGVRAIERQGATLEAVFQQLTEADTEPAHPDASAS